MQKLNDAIAYSASDFVNFLECEHLTGLDLIDLVSPLPRTEDDDEAKLSQDKGHQHEIRFVETLKSQHESFVDIAALGGNRTTCRQAMPVCTIPYTLTVSKTLTRDTGYVT